MWKAKDLIDFKKLPEYKKSEYGVFLGCGSSINAITKNQWKAIEQCDVWVSNNFLYHWYIPDFYHVELKSGKRQWLNLWKRRKADKGDTYDDVKFICNRDHCGHILPQIGEHPMVFGYPRKVWKSNNRCKRDLKFGNHSNNASFTLVLDLLSRMGYKKTILFGVDLLNAKYFWTGKREFGETHCDTNKDRPKKSPHTTAGRVPHFVQTCRTLWFKDTLYLGYEKSLLNQYGIPVVNIERELE
jgi:hypothetical protein